MYYVATLNQAKACFKQTDSGLFVCHKAQSRTASVAESVNHQQARAPRFH